ncbi:hypothetical protein, partial [Blastomonas fulva]|uniref:hypothetical protein n=1 Tax=Blastomonas fulva TaxID=1550728 RepID=UPI004034C6E2
MLYVTIIALLGLFIASASASASASEPFELRDVRLAESTLQAKAAASNQDYLLGTLDVDRLLWA